MDEHSYATVQHISPVVLGICLELLASACYPAPHSDEQCLVLSPLLVNVPLLAVLNSQKTESVIFLLLVTF
jgi:hypothetical protein